MSNQLSVADVFVILPRRSNVLIHISFHTLQICWIYHSWWFHGSKRLCDDGYRHTFRSTYWSTYWHIGWRRGWSTYWNIGWRRGWSTYWNIGWRRGWSTYWSTGGYLYSLLCDLLSSLFKC